MTKTVVIFSVLATASVVLLLLSQFPSPPHSQPNTEDAFDSPASESDLVKAAVHGHGHGTLNLRLSLTALFSSLDKKPKDGKLDDKELGAWLIQKAIDRLHQTTKSALEYRDKDGDGAVSFSEYLYLTKQDIEMNGTGRRQVGWWMQQFKNADADRNGKLNLHEYRDFLHPEDSRNVNIQRWMLTEKIRLVDLDHDERLNLEEFTNGYNTYKSNYVEYQGSRGHPKIPSATDLFTKLDLNKDKVLRVEELKPLFPYLCPGELVHAKWHAISLVRKADEDGDGKLSLGEVLDHQDIFSDIVSSINKGYYQKYARDEL